MGKQFLVALLVFAIAVDARAVPEAPKPKVAGSETPPESGKKDKPSDKQAEIDKLRVESVRLRAQAQEAATKASNGQALLLKHLEKQTKLAAKQPSHVTIIGEQVAKLGRKVIVSDPRYLEGSGGAEGNKVDARTDAAKRLARVLALEPVRSESLQFTEEKELSARALDGLSPAEALPPADKAIPDLEKNRKILSVLAARDALAKKASLETGDAGPGYGASPEFFFYDNNSALQSAGIPKPKHDGENVGLSFATATWGFFYQARKGTQAEKPLDDAQAVALAQEAFGGATPPEGKAEKPDPALPKRVDNSLWKHWPSAVWETAAQADEPNDFGKGFAKAVQTILRIEFDKDQPKNFLAVPDRRVPVTFYKTPTVLTAAFQEAYMVAAFFSNPHDDAFPEMKRGSASNIGFRSPWLWAALTVPSLWANPSRLFVPTTGDHFENFAQLPELTKDVAANDKHFYKEARDLVLEAHDISEKAARAAKAELEDLVKKYEDASKKANDAAKKADDKQKQANAPVAQASPTPSPTRSPSQSAPRQASGNQSPGGSPEDKKDGSKNAGNTPKGGGEGSAGERAKIGDVQPAQIPNQQPFPALAIPAMPPEENSILSQLAQKLNFEPKQAGLNLDIGPLTGGQVFRGADGTATVGRRPASIPREFAGRPGRPMPGEAPGGAVAANSGAAGAAAAGAAAAGASPIGGKGGGGDDGGALNGNFENGVGNDGSGPNGRSRNILSEFVAFGAGSDGASENVDSGASTAVTAAKTTGGPEAPISLGPQLAARGARGVVGILAYVGELKTFTKGKLARKLLRTDVVKLETKREPAVLPPVADAVAEARAL